MRLWAGSFSGSAGRVKVNPDDFSPTIGLFDIRIHECPELDWIPLRYSTSPFGARLLTNSSHRAPASIVPDQ
jgi:hypothetical protein